MIASAQADEAKHEAPSPVRVLLVEDDEDDYVLVRELFQRLGLEYELAWAPSYDSGLQALEGARHDICLLDWALGSRGGLDLLAEAVRRRLTTPIIFLTAQREPQIVFRAMHSGAADFLLKSEIHPGLLERSIHYSLARARTLRQAERSSARLEAALAEKTALLKQLNHRVRNNLQVVSSLLALEARKARGGETVTALRSCVQRVDAISTAYDFFQETGLTSLDAGRYLRDLVERLAHAYEAQPRGIRTVVAAQHTQLDLDVAIPCGLLVHELVSNSLRHAFMPGAPGCIMVELHATPKGSLTLAVSDNGLGVSEVAELEQKQALGFQLIRALTGQLQGTLQCESHAGLHVRIHFRPTRTHLAIDA